MASKRQKVSFNNEQGAVHSVARIDGAASTGGRSTGSVNRSTPDYKQTKKGLIEAFNRSDAPAIITGLLNLRLPSVLKPQGRATLSIEEDALLRRLLWKDFKWAVEIIVKLVPKELGQFGRVTGEMSLADLTRRAESAPKSQRVIELVRQRRADDIESFVVDEENE